MLFIVYKFRKRVRALYKTYRDKYINETRVCKDGVVFCVCVFVYIYKYSVVVYLNALDESILRSVFVFRNMDFGKDGGLKPVECFFCLVSGLFG